MLNARSGSSEIQKVRALLNGKKWNEFYKVAQKKQRQVQSIELQQNVTKSAIENLLEKLKKADNKQEVSDRYWVKNKESFLMISKFNYLVKGG